MEHFSQFFTDDETGQPVRFMINKYDINFLEEYIKVFYKKEVFNMDQSKRLSNEDKCYEVRDEEKIINFMQNLPSADPEVLETRFSDWVEYVPNGTARMIDIFVGATIPHIMAIEGVS